MQNAAGQTYSVGSTRDVLSDSGRQHLSWGKYAERYLESIFAYRSS
jgi:hypothetical protein